MRKPVPFSGEIKIRSYPGGADARSHDSFKAIDMSQSEARTNVKELPYVTFLAGADDSSVVPEIPIGLKPPKAKRGALSYFVARAVEGLASDGGGVTRERLFGYLARNVHEATNERQAIDLELDVTDPAVLKKIVFRLGDTPDRPTNTSPGAQSNPAGGVAADGAHSASDGPAASQNNTIPQDNAVPQTNPVAVAIANGAETNFSKIKKGMAPFGPAKQPEADLVWNVGDSSALSRGDLVMEKVDGSLLGTVIDRTWAIREIQKLSQERSLKLPQPRPLTVRMCEDGRSYSPGDKPELVVGNVRDSYLTVLNLAADGTIQMLFPVYPSHDPHMSTDQWVYWPVVDAPFGADHIVAIATSAPAAGLLAWLKAHNMKRDAALVPAAIARAIEADKAARIGTVGLYTLATPPPTSPESPPSSPPQCL